MADAIVVKGVTKTFGPKVAVRDFDMVVPRGSLMGFIGPNGAGKTTTIRMIMSILFADSGHVEVLGHASALDAKDRIGYLPEERGLYKKMKVGAFLQYVARLKGAEEKDLKQRVHQWLERVGLAEVENKKCEELSKGMQQKIQFISCVLHEPELLILDEPFSGLDPVNMRLLRELILDEHNRGATIVFSTHVMIQAEELCDRLVMIHDGDKVLDDSLDSIRRRFDPRSLRFEPYEANASADPLRALPAVASVDDSNGRWEIRLEDGTNPSAVIRDIAAAVPAAGIEVHRPTLEDVFVQIVTGAPGGPEGDVASLRASLREEAAVASGDTA